MTKSDKELLSEVLLDWQLSVNDRLLFRQEKQSKLDACGCFANEHAIDLMLAAQELNKLSVEFGWSEDLSLEEIVGKIRTELNK